MRIEDIIKKEIMPDHQKTVINLMITANEVSDKATEALYSNLMYFAFLEGKKENRQT